MVMRDNKKVRHSGIAATELAVYLLVLIFLFYNTVDFSDLLRTISLQYAAHDGCYYASNIGLYDYHVNDRTTNIINAALGESNNITRRPP